MNITLGNPVMSRSPDSIVKPKCPIHVIKKRKKELFTISG